MEITVLSLGAGVQSSTLHVMSDRGLVERADYSIFADTGWEPQAVYDHLGFLEQNTSIPIIRVQQGNLREDLAKGVNSTGQEFTPIPMFGLNEEGKPMINRRQCTREYKLSLIHI